MTLQQLEYFIKMAEVLHYTRTAELLYVSQSSLSYSIARLEEELGVSLFETKSNKTKLTDYGKEFLPYAERAIVNINQGVQRIKQMVAPSSTIDFGYIYSLSFDFMPHVLSEFSHHKKGKDIVFNFFQGQHSVIVEKLKKEELEIALTVNPGKDFLESFPVYEQELFVVMPKNHYLTNKSSIEISDLHGEHFVSISTNSSLRQFLDSLFHDEGVQPEIAFVAEECNAMASFVGSNFGLTIMPEIPAISSYQVAVRPFANRNVRRTIYAVWKKGIEGSPAVEEFKRYFKFLATQFVPVR